MTKDETFDLEDRKISRGRIKNAALAQEADDIDDDFDDLDLDRALNFNGMEALPMPKLPDGYKGTWASKTNQVTSISWYQSLGYTLVHPSEVQGHVPGHTSAENEVTINEMVLMKVPTRIWVRIMEKLHREKPDQMDAAILTARNGYEEKVSRQLDGFKNFDGSRNIDGSRRGKASFKPN